MTTSDIPFGDPSLFASECDDAFTELRRRCPVARDDAGRFWVLTAHRDVQAVSRDPETFCSSRGVLLGDLNREVAATDSILYMDPPAHASYRGLVNQAFTARRVAALEPRVRELAVELLGTIDPTTPIDVVDAVTAPLPLLVIAELLGLPRGDYERLRVWSDGIIQAATDLNEQNALVALDLYRYFEERFDERQGDRRDDLLSALADAEVDGARLTRPEQILFCFTLLVAGNETTRALMTGGLVALAAHPDQRASLAADPAKIPAAVEEMLRWTSPIVAMLRTATRDAQVGGTAIAEGERLLMVYAAANRDEEAFGATAGELDVTRAPNPHLAFGIGEHFCMGAGLARLEAKVFFEEVLKRWPTYEIAGPVDPEPSTLIRQIARAPVLFAPR